MSLGFRRILLLILSLVLGFGSVFVLFLLLNVLYDARVNWARYGTGYVLLTAIPMAIFFGIWLDLFLKTKLLPTGPVEAKSEE
jgi:hypothetical protein